MDIMFGLGIEMVKIVDRILARSFMIIMKSETKLECKT